MFKIRSANDMTLSVQAVNILPNILGLFCFLILNACGPTSASLQTLDTQIKQERAQIRALKSAQASVSTYHAYLENGEGTAVLIGKEALQASIKSMLPYTYKGKELDKRYLAGKISFVRVEGLTMSSGNKGRFWLHFDGSKIKTKKVPSYAKGAVKSLKKAVRAGRMLIETTGYIDQKKRVLVLKSTPVQVQFKRENTSSNQSRFLDAARRKIFRKSKRIPLPSTLTGQIKVLTTPNHLVLMRN